jgi:hypothetical protein
MFCWIMSRQKLLTKYISTVGGIDNFTKHAEDTTRPVMTAIPTSAPSTIHNDSESHLEMRQSDRADLMWTRVMIRVNAIAAQFGTVDG